MLLFLQSKVFKLGSLELECKEVPQGFPKGEGWFHLSLWLKAEQRPQVSDQVCSFLAPGQDKIRPWATFGLETGLLTTELDHPFSNWLMGDPGEAAGKLSVNHC